MKKTPWFVIAAFALFVSAFSASALTQTQDTAKDPVCGMSVKKDGAKWTYDYKGTTYYFCSEGCRVEFSKNPEKYLVPDAPQKPMGKMMGQGMRHGQMQGQAAAGGMMAECPMTIKDVERKVETTKDGLVITMSSKNPETLKKLQEHAAKMKDGGCCQMKKDPAGGMRPAKEAEDCAGGCCAKKK